MRDLAALRRVRQRRQPGVARAVEPVGRRGKQRGDLGGAGGARGLGLVGGRRRWPTNCGIYEPLLIYNSVTGDYVPWLATDWAWEADGEALVFTIRDGVKWSDGKPLTAGDVAFTVDQQQYLQGYLPVVLMYLEATNANQAGGGLPVLTGPGFVTPDNAAEVKELSAQGTR